MKNETYLYYYYYFIILRGGGVELLSLVRLFSVWKIVGKRSKAMKNEVKS